MLKINLIKNNLILLCLLIPLNGQILNSTNSTINNQQNRSLTTPIWSLTGREDHHEILDELLKNYDLSRIRPPVELDSNETGERNYFNFLKIIWEFLIKDCPIPTKLGSLIKLRNYRNYCEIHEITRNKSLL
ncbi:unnamed protein product [Meloidogyne enterolobii]|uniref:Uncharacterized protein n=1 Tax=Meloidogyne enterolobii TaxID=390850 RepID=A0ACB0YZ44_MELEN